MPPAARVTDPHSCPKAEGNVPHVGGPVLPAGEPTVLIGYMPAARRGDTLTCQGPTDTIAKGEPSVQIGYKDAARMGDTTAHGGAISSGCPNVNIGGPAQAQTLVTRKPFCEECERNTEDGSS